MNAPFRAVQGVGIVATIVLLRLATQQACGGERNSQFQIGTSGRYILLPLTLVDREILGLFDTGSSASAFDTSLAHLLGKAQGRKVIHTPAGESSTDVFEWPAISLGSEKLRTTKAVACFDLDPARKECGVEFFAIIGMDVLKNHRVQIDFDAGTLRFIETIPEAREDLGERLPIILGPNGTPCIRGSMHGRKGEPFLIDTGAFDCSIQAELFDELVAQQQIHQGASSMSVTAGGALTAQTGRLDELSVGPFRHANLRVSRINVNSVGLRYLSRFRVTFDFPGKCVYLKKGNEYSRPEPTATGGLSLAWFDGEIVVVAVQKNGPAARIGIKPNDVLLRVDGKDASEFDALSLKILLTSEIGRTVPLTVRRRTRELEMTIVLDEK